ncbi:MAG: glycoside hydrolase family 2 TIM barrel-domain containing protein [Chloroflexota bacterium]
MRRQSSLSGTWQFQVDPVGSLTISSIAPDREIPVPMPWQAVFPELEQYSGYAWYSRSFTLEEDWLEGELLLRFGAVDYWCQVFVNGTLAGEHEGGYTPFTLPVGAFVHEGENKLAVRVYDVAQSEITIDRWPKFPARETTDQPPFDANEIPHGKQEWYINAGGIWQDVTITAVSRTYIDTVHVTTDIHTGEVHLKIMLAGTGTGSDATALHAIVSDGEGEVEASVPLTGDGTAYTLPLRVEQPHLWNTEDPHLYTATVTLQAGRAGVVGSEDSLTVRFGFREVKTDGGRLLLNGEPIFLLCALDQDMYADTIYTVPSEEYLRDQFRKAKELGLNSLRCHIKPPDPRYLDLADEMGILIWTEIPSWRTFYVKGTRFKEQLDLGETIQHRVERTMEEMLQRDFNHPSIIIWTIVNEDWGTTLPLSASDRKWVVEMYDKCKELDPTRLVVDNSACPHPWGPNIHVKSDLDDFHIYANIPEQVQRFERTVEQFNLRPLWTYSSFGDAQRTGDEPLILSEFGNWGLPSLHRLREPYGGKDPNWLKTGPWWNSWEGEAGWPSGVEERFQRLGLSAIWEDFEQFAVATQWHQFAALKFQIEAMRRQPALMGYVITELSDIYWESNGLLDFNRNPKVYHDIFHQVNAPDVISVRPDCYAYWQDEPVTARLFVSHYSGKEWKGAQLQWSIPGGDAGNAAVRGLKRGEVAALGKQTWTLPEVDRARTITVQLSIQSESGEEYAKNSVDLLVLPTSARATDYQTPVTVMMQDLQSIAGSIQPFDRPPEGIDFMQPGDSQDKVESDEETGAMSLVLQKSMKKLGYNVSTKLSADTEIAITNYPNERLLKWVREGGKLLYQAEGTSPFYWVQSRAGSYGGSWLTAFSWLRPDVHKRLEVQNPLSMPYKKVIPTNTILGLPVEDSAVQGDFLAGLVSGWVGHPAVHTVQFRYGKGTVIMTTFRISEGIASDTIATALMLDLIDHLRSDACQPILKANY